MTPVNLKDTLPTIETDGTAPKHAPKAQTEAVKPESDQALAPVPKRRVPLAGKIVIAVLALALCGGGVAVALHGNQASEPAKQESSDAAATEAAEPAKQVTSKVDGAMVFYRMANRGDTLTITGEDGRYYTAVCDGTNVLVEKSWVRLASEQQPVERKAYANDMVPLYKTGFLIGDPVTTLPLDTEVTVVDERDGWLFVKTAEGVTGFGRASDFRSEEEKRAEEEAAEAAEEQAESSDYSYDYSYNYSYDYSYDSGSGGGDYSPSTSPAPAPEYVPTPSTDGADGGDIVLAGYAPNVRFSFVETAYADEVSSSSASPSASAASPSSASAGTSSASASSSAASTYGEAVVLSDGVSLYLAKLDRGQSVDQADAQAKGGDSVDTVLVKVDGVEGTVPRALVRLEDEAPFTPVDAYAKDEAVVFADYQLAEEARTCALNDTLRLVDEYGDNYVVEDAGKFFYIPKESVGLTKFEEPEEEAQEQPAEEGYDPGYTESYSYEPSYSEPESTPAPAPAPEPAAPASEPEWTEPVL